MTFFSSFTKENFQQYKKELFVAFFSLLFFVGLDFLSKEWIRTYLPLHESIEVIPRFFYLTHHINKGAAFSFLAEAQGGLLLLTGISFVASIVLACLFLKACFTPVENVQFLEHEPSTSTAFFVFEKKLQKQVVLFSLLFLEAGCIGNLLDRFFLQGVTDMLDFRFGSYAFAVFNLADVFVSVGAFFFFLLLLFQERKHFLKKK